MLLPSHATGLLYWRTRGDAQRIDQIMRGSDVVASCGAQGRSCSPAHHHSHTRTNHLSQLGSALRVTPHAVIGFSWGRRRCESR